MAPNPPDDLQFDRRLTASAVERIEEIVRETGMFSDAEVRIARELLDDGLRRPDKSGYRFLVVRRHGEIAGYTCWGHIDGTAASYDLYWIAVDPAAHRTGLGTALLRATEDAIRTMGGERIYVETSGRPDYAPTRAFYERSGYARVAHLPDFYGPQDDKLIYQTTV